MYMYYPCTTCICAFLSIAYHWNPYDFYFLCYFSSALISFSTWIEMNFGCFLLSIDAGELQECCQSALQSFSLCMLYELIWFSESLFFSIDPGELQECCQSLRCRASTCACFTSWYDFQSPCFSALMLASYRSVVSLRCRASTCACFTSRWSTWRRRAGMRTCSTWTMTWCLSLLWFVCQQSTYCRWEVRLGILKVCRCMSLW